MAVKYTKSKKYDDVYSYVTSSGDKMYCFRFKYYRNGKRKEMQRSKYTTEKQAYQAMLIHRFECESNDFTKVDSNKVRLRKMGDIYLSNKKEFWAASTYKRNRTNIEKHINPRLGDMKINDLSPMIVQKQLINDLIGDYEPLTIEGIVSTLMSVVNYAVDNDLIVKNRLSGKLYVPEHQKDVTYYDKKTLHEILKCADNMQITYKTIIYLFAYTGMRISELLGLRWTDINFNDHTISIKRTRDDKNDEFKTKNLNSKRTIYVDSSITALLKEYYFYIDTKAFKNNKNIDINGFIFLGTRDMNPIKKAMINTQLNKIGKMLNINVHSHAFRHTHATLLLQAGETYHYISNRLGNTPMIIESTYGHYYDSSKKKVSDAFSNIMKNDVSEELSEVIKISSFNR
ncbi:tyrosine-type recombinase/integrase [Macrococcus armenti]|uniref:tyrosine-type recombinase/integrase n=1 Tax=Macrococcus armenti TaxID=2875764 RepID=UPI001CD3AA8D|nr:site-specific integrase [Macrococcus armenti]UBH10640.1 site-specific integrase [Macrococcus armenti]